MLPAASHSIKRRRLLFGEFRLGVVFLRGRKLQQPTRIAHDRSPSQLLAHDVLDIFERPLIGRKESEPVTIAPLTRPPVLDPDMNQVSPVSTLAPLPRTGRHRRATFPRLADDRRPKIAARIVLRELELLTCMCKFSKEFGDLQLGMWQTRHTPGRC